MKQVKGLKGLYVLIGVSLLALVYTLVVGNRPFLGLDLQGGVSVVLKSKEQVDDDALEQAKRIIDSRINALGVAEPEITRQGDNVLVQIAGVKDKDRALELVGQTAEMRFRPVLAMGGPPGADQQNPGQQGQDGQTTDATAPGGSTGDTVTVDQGSGASGAGQADTVDEQGLRRGAWQIGESAQGVVGEDPTGSPTPGGSESPSSTVVVQGGDGSASVEVSGGDSGVTVAPGDVTQQPTATAGQGSPLPDDVCTAGVPPEMDQPDQQVILPQCNLKTREFEAVYALGPTALSGTALETARASLDQTGQWVVNPVFKPGSDGIDQFNKVAAECYSKAQTCPTGQLAIVLDGNVISAPAIQVASFQRDQIQISGSFNERTAKDLATALKYGALPVAFEVQQAQVVSATLGHDALQAGLVAGLVGLIAVAIYMIAWYRLLGALSVLKLFIEGALLWSVISFLGTHAGLALTLAGVTGIIVSIGMSFDSNVVYYEHIKEDIRAGRSVRSASDKAFDSSFSTIVKADMASLIGAAVLWYLSIGPVRGFAFYLGLSTLLDLITSYLYMRPVVALATRGDRAQAHPRWFGLPPNPEADDRHGPVGQGQVLQGSKGKKETVSPGAGEDGQ